jgi:phage gpG-like protein
MPNSLADELKRLQADFKVLQKNLPREVGNITRNNFLANFDKEAFNTNKWTPRKFEDEGKKRNLLVKSGKLRRSIRVTMAQWGNIRVGSNMDYAQIHNEGGTTHPNVTPRMRKFAWAMYYKKKGSAGKVADSTRDSDIRKYTKANKAAGFWLALALTDKKKLTIKIPRRQYMGQDSELEKQITNHIAQRVSTLLGREVRVIVRL